MPKPATLAPPDPAALIVTVRRHRDGGVVLVLAVVLVLENFDRSAIRLTEQISSIGLFAVTKSQCTEDEHDDEDDSKFRNLGLRAL